MNVSYSKLIVVDKKRKKRDLIELQEQNTTTPETDTTPLDIHPLTTPAFILPGLHRENTSEIPFFPELELVTDPLLKFVPTIGPEGKIVVGMTLKPGRE